MPLDITPGSFNDYIKKGINALKAKDYPAARKYIELAMLENAHAPQVHNLLGKLAELAGDLSLAGKHYRAAYAFDPTYQAASRNLERITSFSPNLENENPDFGDQPQTEETVISIIDYDEDNIGHLRKKER